MSDVTRLLGRQADWQKSLKDLPWPEKVRIVARLRLQVQHLRKRDPSVPDDKNHRSP